MASKLFHAVALGLVAGIFAPSAHAQETDEADLRAVLGQTALRSVYIEDFIDKALQPLRQADTDFNGLDSDDLKRIEDKRIATDRARRLSALIALDRDGDNRVTRDEVAAADPRSDPQRVDAAWKRHADFDTNGDGVIDLHEAIDAKLPPPLQQNRESQVEKYLKLEPSGDGVLTVAELKSLAREAFAAVDTDGSGVISEDERRAYAAILRPPRPVGSNRAQTDGCELPRPDDNEEIVLFGGFHGAAVSNVSLIGQSGETTVTTLQIEPGEKPLYVVAVSYKSMIFRVVGAAGRVTHFVLANAVAGPDRVPGVGVVGIEPGRVSVGSKGRCLTPFYVPASVDGVRAAATLKKELQRAPDVVIGKYRAMSVALPSGRIVAKPSEPIPAPQGFDARLWAEAISFNPAGIAEIDPKAVVGPGVAMPYSLFPLQFRLAQLVAAGNIEALADGDYKIVKPFERFPGGLVGGHSARFVLGKDIPMPQGASVHSCVVSEKTGEIVKGSYRCGMLTETGHNCFVEPGGEDGETMRICR